MSGTIEGSASDVQGRTLAHGLGPTSNRRCKNNSPRTHVVMNKASTSIEHLLEKVGH